MFKTQSLCAALVLSLTPATAFAQPNPSIQVTAQPITVVTWAKHTGKLLDRSLLRLRNVPDQMDGIVSVKFLCNDTGAPSEVALLRSSGSKALDAAAIKAVNGISSLHPLPDGVTQSQKFVATVLFARNEASYARQIGALREAAKSQNAKLGNAPTTYALGIGLLDEKGEVQVN